MWRGNGPVGGQPVKATDIGPSLGARGGAATHVRSPMTRNILLGLAGFAMAACPSGEVRAAGEVQAPVAAKTILGESCVTKDRPGTGLNKLLPVDRDIVCEGVASGSLTFALANASGQSVAERFAGSRQGAALLKRLDCETPRVETSESAAATIFACRQRSDGWPVIVIATADDSVLRVAEGPASTYPVLRGLLGLPTAGSSNTEVANKVRALWSTPIKIGSAADQAAIKVLLRQARTAAGQSDYEPAEAGFRRALELQTRTFGEDDLATNDILMDLAMAVSAQGRHAEAEALIRRAAPIVEKSPKPSDRARLSGYQAYIAAYKGDFDSALLQARAATSQWRAIAAQAASQQGGTGIAGAGGGSEAEAELAMALNLEAAMLLRTGDVTSAFASVGEAMLLIKRVEGEPRWWEADILVTLGNVSSAQGRLSAAEAYLKRALALRQQVFGEGVATLQARVALARAYQVEHMRTSAIITFREAVAVARTLPKSSIPFTSEDLVPFFEAVLEEAQSYDDPKVRLGLYAEVFDAVQLTRSPIFDRAMALTSARRSAATPELEALLGRLEAAVQTERELRVQLATQQSLMPQERSAVDEERYAAEISAQGKAIADLRQLIAKQFPDFAATTDASVPKLDDLRRRLGPDEGALSFVIGRSRSFAQLVTKDGIALAAIPAGEAALQDSVSKLRRGLEVQGKSVNDFDLETAYDLYTTVFGGLAADMSRLKRLVVIPAGPLANLPFSLLVREPANPGQYLGAHWLARDLDISYSPTLSSFVALRSTRLIGSHPKKLLALGNPVLAPLTVGSHAVAPETGNDCGAGGIVPAALLRSLSSLPDTAREIADVARALGGSKDDILLGDKATESAFRGRRLADYRILYFATHGLLPSELRCQAQPGVVLTPPQVTPQTRSFDGLLDASEIAGMTIPAELVVLSACNTAASGKANGGESLSGLAASFFQAGARSLVVSHWQVPSAATSALMSEMFSIMGSSKDMPVDAALRAAQARLYKTPAYAHPFFWAAFVVMGDGQSTPLASEAGR